MKVLGIHHVSLKCSMEEYRKAIEFYTGLLGFKVYKEWETGILLSTGMGYIEIFNNDEILPKGQIRHIAFEVDDVDKFADALQANGYDVFVGPKDINLSGLEARIAFSHGVLGEELEFFQVKNNG